MNLTTLRKSFHRFNSSTLTGAQKSRGYEKSQPLFCYTYLCFLDTCLHRTSGCFISCPPEPTISWTEVDFDTVRPQKPVFSWTGEAQSRRSEPFGVARAACFEQLAGRCQLRCPSLSRDSTYAQVQPRGYFATSALKDTTRRIMSSNLYQI